MQSNDFKPYEKLANTYHYDKEIDMYFYKEVGYDTMWTIVSGLFPTPYSATSLREYFAIGFEEFYMGAQTDLRKICPILFSKLSELNQFCRTSTVPRRFLPHSSKYNKCSKYRKQSKKEIISNITIIAFIKCNT